MKSFIKDKLGDIKELCKTYDVKSMHIFGSACTDDFQEDSDIDILIAFKDISIEEYTDNYFDLWLY